MTGERAHAWRVAVWILIASEALLFAALFALYVGYRAEYPEAFARGAAEDVGWIGGLLTMILIGSSCAMALATLEVRAGRTAAAARWMLLVMAIGAAFVALKLAEWFIHIHDGIVAGTGYHGPIDARGIQLFFTLYFLMTGLHMFHLVAGIAMVAWVYVLVRGPLGATRGVAVECVGLYWNFVDAIWMFLWPLFYLMRAA